MDKALCLEIKLLADADLSIDTAVAMDKVRCLVHRSASCFVRL